MPKKRDGEARFTVTGASARVLIVSDILLYREGLLQVMREDTALSVVAAAHDRPSALRALDDLHPDIVLLDMTTPMSHSIIADARKHGDGVPVVALAVSDAEEDVLAAMEAGIAGYVSRNASVDDLHDVVASALRGELKVSPQIAGSLLRRIAALKRGQRAQGGVGRLTVREADVARLIERNLSNKEIAAELKIEVATVKNHVHNLLDKLQVHRRRDVSISTRENDDR
jgi:DNA-binding NarL/FixJ family response regulator